MFNMSSQDTVISVLGDEKIYNAKSRGIEPSSQ
jgi:hypothetical protein